MSKYEMRVATPMERMYMYANSKSIQAVTGFVGYLRGYFTNEGKTFYSDWTDGHWRCLNDKTFKTQFDAFMRHLIERGPLAGLAAMETFCCNHREAAFEGNYTTEYAFRVEIGDFVHLIRFIPVRGDNTVYIHSYSKLYLDMHLRRAEEGVALLSLTEKGRYRVPDGGKVKFTWSDGSSKEATCRVVDFIKVQFNDKEDAVFDINDLKRQLQENGVSVDPVTPPVDIMKEVAKA